MIQIYSNIKNEIEILKIRKELLNKEEISINELLHNKENKLSTIERHLKELKGIQNKLYYQIVVLGNNPTKAVDKVAFDADKDVSTIWKNYYPEVRKYLDELKNLPNV